MNTFDSRWQELTRRARAVRTLRPEAAPFGFGRRVAARAAEPPAASADDLWVRFSVRSLIAVSSLLLVLGVMEWRSAPRVSPLSPGVENTVAQLLGTL